MKILLLGEFSALHKNLGEGLRDLGHNAVVASTGDGFKKIPADISLDFNSGLASPFSKIHTRLQLLSKVREFSGFDVVQMISPFIFPQLAFPNRYCLRYLKRNNSKLFLSAAGSDAYFWKYGRKALKYGPFDDFLKYDLKKDLSPMESKRSFLFNKWALNLSDGVIPIMYEYEVSYNHESKRLNTIPIPVNLTKIKYNDNKNSGKLVVFHGLNRYGFKGTRHVEKAFEILKSKYPNDLELIIEGNLPLDKYLALMERTNVVIDQMYSYSLGVNGVYALAMGKVVLGGCEPESLISHNVSESPVVNLEPSPESIIYEIERLLENRTKLPEFGHESRTYAEKVHDHIKVAEKYLLTWKSN